MNRKFTYILPILFLLGCSKPGDEASKKLERHNAEINSVFEAHGGYHQWSKMSTLSYEIGEESQIISLNDRKVRLENEERTIGFDGEQVWIHPAEAEVQNARFYHSLYFYFFAMPFVLGDPGITYENLPDRSIKGQMYKPIKISYGTEVGDSPKDSYILFYHPETNKMEWLMYNSTYRTQESSDRYNLIKYDLWEEVNGLLLPKVIQWYVFENGEALEPRNEVIFENVMVTEDLPEQEQFAMPDSARIAE